MKELKEQLNNIEKKLDEIEKKKSSERIFEKVIPIVVTIFLGLAGIFISWNQIKISKIQVELQENKLIVDSIQNEHRLELEKLQDQISLDHQYVELVYNDVLSGNETRKNGALKLIKKMRPEIAIVFIEMFENTEITEQQKKDIEEVQVTYTNYVKKEKVTVGIHELNFNNKNKIQDILNYLKKENFKVIGNFSHNNKLSWMAPSSTVFYYGNEKSEERAKEIASNLEQITDLKFKIQKGAGLGVDKNRKDYHHFIHIIEN
ncbi:hypothetical protein E9993_14865 [Labilibacter sediminis]|nr:hypothetical protein E9993_14865 [Labilibacter sediminis]